MLHAEVKFGPKGRMPKSRGKSADPGALAPPREGGGLGWVLLGGVVVVCVWWVLGWGCVGVGGGLVRFTDGSRARGREEPVVKHPPPEEPNKIRVKQRNGPP